VLIDRADVLKALRDTLNVTDNRVTQAFGKPWLDDAASRIMAIQPALPASTADAREVAWKALLAYAECEQSFESPTTEAMYATLARHGWVEGTPPIRFVMDLRAKALALARSTGGA